jgi:multimeric flavodoxin WrbA
MTTEILGISGSPVKNSNTDRLVNAVLDAAGLESEFIKLSRLYVRPCLACKRCVRDNICKVEDDFQNLADKIRSAKALVIGAYTPYGQIDAFTKALLERFWSFRHVNNLLEGKLCVTILTGLNPTVVDAVNRSLAAEIRNYERMDLVAQLSVHGNLPCLTCGEGDTCKMSAVTSMHGPDAITSECMYSRVEEQKDVWEETIRVGRRVGERVRTTAKG